MVPTCEDCKYSVDLGEQGIECRERPPQLMAMPGQLGLDGRPTISITSFFPRMARDGFCGRFEIPETVPPNEEEKHF